MTNIIKEKKKLGRKVTLVPEKIIETIQAIQAEGRDFRTACCFSQLI